MNDPRFGYRMSGTGEHSEQINRMFAIFLRRLGLDGGLPPFDLSRFKPPADAKGQGRLF